MNNLKAVVVALLGLFVDDGSLAFAVLGTVLVAAVLAHLFPDSPAIAGGALMLACIAILAENILRSARG
ncbi:MAG: hypothetical protein NVSMB26_20700 [Beijerinckiaceae bacterium]